jgi:hypothetical protein
MGRALCREILLLWLLLLLGGKNPAANRTYSGSYKKAANDKRRQQIFALLPKMKLPSHPQPYTHCLHTSNWSP